MSKLYYTPTSCGASSFICAFIGNLNFDCEVVDLATHKTESGIDFYTINPKGNVPCIILEDNTILNENISCLEYIADLSFKNGINLSPESQSSERYLLTQILSFIASELHATIGLLFNPATVGKIRDFVLKNFDRKMIYLEKYILNTPQFVLGDSFTIADAYLHIVLSWTGYVGIDLSKYQIAQNYYSNICNLPLVKMAKNRMSSIPERILN